jgi:hypothetical protein
LVDQQNSLLVDRQRGGLFRLVLIWPASPVVTDVLQHKDKEKHLVKQLLDGIPVILPTVNPSINS